jgi:hypothetical protein
MTTRTEKIRKLRALARSPNKHEAALALEKAQQLERTTAKAIAIAIGELLKERGLTVRVRRRDRLFRPASLPPAGPAGRRQFGSDRGRRQRWKLETLQARSTLGADHGI